MSTTMTRKGAIPRAARLVLTRVRGCVLNQLIDALRPIVLGWCRMMDLTLTNRIRSRSAQPLSLPMSAGILPKTLQPAAVLLGRYTGRGGCHGRVSVPGTEPYSGRQHLFPKHRLRRLTG